MQNRGTLLACGYGLVFILSLVALAQLATTAAAQRQAKSDHGTNAPRRRVIVSSDFPPWTSSR